MLWLQKDKRKRTTVSVPLGGGDRKAGGERRFQEHARRLQITKNTLVENIGKKLAKL